MFFWVLYVIFMMVFLDYVLESYEFVVVDYLFKLFFFQCFVQVVSKIFVLVKLSFSKVVLLKEFNDFGILFVKLGYIYF